MCLADKNALAYPIGLRINNAGGVCELSGQTERENKEVTLYVSKNM